MTKAQMFDVFEDSDSYGRVLALKGSWCPSISESIRSQKISTLRLSEYLGWSDGDIEFVRGLDSLSGLEIYTGRRIDASPIQSLPNLKFLSVQYKGKKTVDISNFDKLTTLKFNWKSLIFGFENLNNVKHLNVVDFGFSNLDEISSMRNLSRLQLTSNALKSLKGISNLSSLEVLDLFKCRNLSDVSSLQDIDSLVELEIESCGSLSKIVEYVNFKNLKHLKFDNCGSIGSIKNLSSGIKIESLSFNGNTLIEDGNISVLLNLKNLLDVQFEDRKLYNIKRSDLLKMLKK